MGRRNEVDGLVGLEFFFKVDLPGVALRDARDGGLGGEGGVELKVSACVVEVEECRGRKGRCLGKGEGGRRGHLKICQDLIVQRRRWWRW